MPTESAKAGKIIEASDPRGPGKGRSGAIVLARHGEPALSRKVWLSSRQYREWWALYEAGGILAGQSPPDHLVKAAARAGVIYTSTRLRAKETALALVEGRDFSHEEIFVEAPLPPPQCPDFIKLSPKTWGVISRLSWWLGHHRGEETRRDAQKRAAQAATLLDEAARRGEDVLVVAHGFFNTMVGLELRKLGWRLVKGRGWRYWSTRYYER
ncbi:MAG TPA: histidine phosphatase family protein [Caulobacteraceae bacterium]|nr:histidine phosphatase family protein [Caulobacteraceae bacterium]